MVVVNRNDIIYEKYPVLSSAWLLVTVHFGLTPLGGHTDLR